MKMDFHCHILLTNKAPFNIDLFEKTIRQSKKMRLNALAITEHMSAAYIRLLEVVQTGNWFRKRPSW